jgi:histidinol-phosphate aminotransferase
LSDRTKLIVLCSPNNPSGNSLTLDAVRRCAQAGPALLVDAAYADFDPDVDLSPLVHEHRNVVLARTFSQAYCLAGLRVGYVVGAANVLDHVERFLVPGSSVSSASLHAGLAALGDEEYHRRQVARILAERERLLGRLRDLGVTAYESRGNFVAFDAAAHPGEAVGLVGEVRARGVVIRAMDEGLVRVSVGTSSENDAAVAAIAAVRSAAAAA